MSNFRVILAVILATYWHWKAGNRRKYTNEPYIVHPKEVARLVSNVDHDSNMIAAAWLHDVVEDANVKLNTIRRIFGNDIATLVDELTDRVSLATGNRARRVALNTERLAKISGRAQTIKYADIACNVRDIALHDPDFCKVYVEEKKRALQVMTQGNSNLLYYAKVIVGRASRSVDYFD